MGGSCLHRSSLETDFYRAKKEALAKVNSALRIIESGLVKEAMEYVMGACEGSECEAEAKAAAKELLESLASGAVALPEFHK